MLKLCLSVSPELPPRPRDARCFPSYTLHTTHRKRICSRNVVPHFRQVPEENKMGGGLRHVANQGNRDKTQGSFPRRAGPRLEVCCWCPAGRGEVKVSVSRGCGQLTQTNVGRGRGRSCEAERVPVRVRLTFASDWTTGF